MDNNEDPLGKISRQLSELASAPTSGVAQGASLNVGGEWTQFSGISPQAGQPPFRNLYTWNPMDLPDFKPLSPPPQPPANASTAQHLPEPGSLNSRSPTFMSQRQFDYPRDISSQQYQVTGDLAGRLVDISRQGVGGSPDHILGQGRFPYQEQVFQYDSSSQGAGMPMHSQMSQPSTPNTFAGSDRSGRLSAPGSPNFSMLSHHMMSMNSPSDRFTPGFSQDGISRDAIPQAQLNQSPPVFDPSTPPPTFPVSRQTSESMHSQASSLSTNTSQQDDFMDFLRMQGKTNINLDLGINIDKGNRQCFSDVDNSVASAEGRQLYENAMKQWHSFESGNSSIPAVDKMNLGVSPSPSQDVVTETSSTDSLKPSYSDIAKTPKSGATVGSRIDQSSVDSSIRGFGTAKPVKKENKAFRPPVKRTSSGSKFWPRVSQGGDADQAKMSPTSRYGLDNFDDHVFGPGSHSSSSESLAQAARSRRGSGSSAGSSISALDDITSGRSLASENELNHPRLSTGSPDHKQSGHSAAASKPPPSSKPPSSSGQSDSKETLFFDPRRIFQNKNTNKSRAQTQSSTSIKTKGSSGVGLDDFGTLHTSSSDTVLNNGKPTASTSSSKLSSSARQHDYINNDLRDASKLTNQTAAVSGHQGSGRLEETHRQKESRGAKRSGNRTNGVYRRDRKKSPDSGHRHEEETEEDDPNNERGGQGFLFRYVDTEKLEEWLSMGWERVSQWGSQFITSLLHLLIYLMGLILFLATGIVHLVRLLIGKIWTLIKEKVFKGHREETTWNSRDFLRRRVGLEENIGLPGTGEEAMKRLLACRGKDPYSILGLRADASDEDIKKYYRKQAVLVHPDKNQEPGAEEAFKVLGHAFEMIGEPAKRKQYDSHTQEANEADAMREFAEMLSKLQTKLQEAANIMRCDNCGGKHRRVPVDRPFYSARACERCNMRHSAKEGDVWAESTMLGFYWHYYALMEGHVFDITEWMKCHKEYFKHMKANAHSVMYKISTDGSRRSKHNHSGEPNLEDFIKKLFNKSGAAGGEGQGPAWGNPHAGPAPGWGQGTSASRADAAAAAAAAAKKGRRKKKRH